MDFCKSAEELAVGDKASLLREVGEADLALFAAATGDLNPIHFDVEYAESTFFKGKIAHGILSAGLVSAVIANRLPGLGTVYVSQNLRFLAPVRIGDRILAEVEVLAVDVESNRVHLRTTCTNAEGTLVLDGEAVVLPPKRKPASGKRRAMSARSEENRRSLDEAVAAFEAARQPDGEAGPRAPAESPAGPTWWRPWSEMTEFVLGQSEVWLDAWVDQAGRTQSGLQELTGRVLREMADPGVPPWGSWCRSWNVFFPGPGEPAEG